MNTIFDIQRFSDIIKDGNGITVDGTNSNDIISTSGESIIIDAKKGNDRITHSSGKAVTIKGGAGKESIAAYAEEAYIDGGEGNDLIVLNKNSRKATIIGGAGNDTIAVDHSVDGGTGRTFIYSDGDGNDFIQGLKASDTIIIATENGSLPVFSEKQDGDDYIINIGSGKITLDNAASIISSVTFATASLTIDSATEIISTSGTATVTVPTLFEYDKYGSTVTNAESNVVYDLVGGADKFGNNGGSNVLVYGGAGNDSLTNSSGSKVTLSGDAGNDSLQANGGSEILLLGGAGNDLFTIGSGAASVTVNGGAGNDYIDAQNDSAGNYYIYGEGEGKDTIAGYKTGDTIQLTAGYVDTSKAAFSGSDFVITVGSGSITLKDLAKSTISAVEITTANGIATINIPQELLGTKSADNLINSKSGSSESPFKIDALAGNDKINNTGDYVSIFGGAGNDTISLGGGTAESINHGTINGGKGNDVVTITSDKHAYLFEYASGDGNDIIYGLGSSDTLEFTSGSISSAVFDGTDYVITVGKNSITLKNIEGGSTFTTMNADGDSGTATVPLTWRGTKNADTLDNAIAGYELYALGGSDSITNSGADVYIEGDVGDDYISNTGVSVIIDGGAGKDTISNKGNGASIVGGAGNDSIYNFGSSLTAGEDLAINVTISGGDGADTIDNIGSGVEIYGDDDNDIINSSGSNVKLYGGAGNDNISVGSSATGVTVGGGKGNDTITIETVAAAEGAEAKAHTFVYASGDGNDNIYGYGANDSFNIYGTDGETTLSASDYSTSISDKDLIITVGTGKNAGKITLHNVVGTVSQTTINGETVNITKITYGTSDSESITVEENDTKVEALAGNDTITIDENVTGTTVVGGTGNDYIYGNDEGNVYIYNDGDGNDTIKGFTASDTITLGEDAKLGDTVVSGTDLILNIGKGSIVLTKVIGGENPVSEVKVGDTTINLATVKPVLLGTTKADKFYDKDANKGNGVLVSVMAGNDTVENFGSDVTVLAGAGNDFLYNEGASSELYGEAGNDTIENYADNVTIDGGAGVDHIFSAGDSTSLLGGDGNDSIESFGDSVVIDGGAGADYVYSDGTGNSVGGGAGNDTVEIAGSSNTVVYTGGNDTVYGFSENDTVKIGSAQLSGTSADGTDVILKIGSGSVRLMDMAGKTIHYIDSSGDDAKSTVVSGAITGTARADKIDNEYAGFTINALAGNDTVTNSGASANIDGGTGADLLSNTGTGTSIFGGTGNDIITSSGASVTIDGGQGHDKITVGSGSSGVTVEGGKGNDTITASSASNVLFNYASGDGRDVIVGFSDGDTLQITSGSIDSTVESGDSDVVLKIGTTGSVKLVGAKDKISISNNNTVTYTAASGGNGNAAVPWFAEDDTNFIGGATVDEITAQEYSVTNVESSGGTDELTQLEKFAASYSGDK